MESGWGGALYDITKGPALPGPQSPGARADQCTRSHFLLAQGSSRVRSSVEVLFFSLSTPVDPVFHITFYQSVLPKRTIVKSQKVRGEPGESSVEVIQGTKMSSILKHKT